MAADIRSLSGTRGEEIGEIKTVRLEPEPEAARVRSIAYTGTVNGQGRTRRLGHYQGLVARNVMK